RCSRTRTSWSRPSPSFPWPTSSRLHHRSHGSQNDVTRGHRRYLNGPGRPPISGFGFAQSSGKGRCAPVLKYPRTFTAPTALARGEGRRPPCTPSSVLDFVHSGSAPVLAKASPKPELDGRRPRLRYRGWTRGLSPTASLVV